VTQQVTFEPTRPADAAISPDGKYIYSAGADGYLRTYSAESGLLVSAAKIGTQLGGIDVAPDGSYLMVVDRTAYNLTGNPFAGTGSFDTRVYKVDTATGQTTTYTLHIGSGLDSTFYDVAALSDGRVLLTQSFNGSGWVAMKLLNLNTGEFALGPDVRQNSVITPSADHSKVFIAEANISNGAMDVYQVGAGIVARGGFNGFNFGIDAFSPNANLAATYDYSNGVQVFDSQLKPVVNLAAAHPEWAGGNVTDLTFDSTGQSLFVLDNKANAIVQLSTADWSIVQTVPLDADVGGWSNATNDSYGNRLLIDPTGRFFTVVTDTGLIVAANPMAPAFPATSGDDVITGDLFGETLSGLGGDDILAGNGGDDVLSGDAGNDRLDGGLGADTAVFVLPAAANAVLKIIPYAYGDPRDFTVEEWVTTSFPGYSYTQIAARVNVRFDGATATVTGYQDASSLGSDTVTNVETLRFSIAGVDGSEVAVDRLTTVFGTAAADALDGTAGRDVIDALGGNDRVAGGTGSDTLLGGDGDDILSSGTGIDRLSGGTGDDIFYFGADYTFDDIVDGGSGFDRVVLQGGYAMGWIAFEGIEAIQLLPQGDSTYGPALATDTYYDLQNYNDRQIAAGGTFTVDGSALSKSWRFIGVGETDGGWIILGGSAGDDLRGGGGADLFRGAAGNDSIVGDGGDDLLDGGAGNDSLDGGAGNDTASYADAAAAVTVSLAAPGQQNTVGAGLDTLQRIENLTGSNYSDTLAGDGGDNRLDGGAGADALAGGLGNDTYIVDDYGDTVTELAGQGTDTIRTALGTQAALYGLAANVESLVGTSNSGQTVAGNALDNVLAMGAGNDVLDLSSGGNDTANGGSGNDYIYFGAAFTAADNVVGGAGTDTVGLLGTYDLTLGANTLSGVETFSLLSGTAAGGTDHVTYAITTVDSNVPAGGRLTVYAGGLLADESLFFNGYAETDGALSVYGGAGNDTFAGGPANDAFVGGAGDDTMYGLGGMDWLEGGLGADTMRGGPGNDLFVYQSAGESTAAKTDHILDFEYVSDHIDLTRIDANTSAAGDQAFTFIGSDAFSHTAGELRAYQSGASWFVEGDVDGDGVVDLVVQVDTAAGHAIITNDFLL